MAVSESLVWLDGTARATSADVGGKAASLDRLASLGLTVPPAFALPIPLCAEFRRVGGRLPQDAATALRDGMTRIEEATGKRFGDSSAPLLVSVRSGAAVSMPGMMDTVLNVGMTAQVEAALGRITEDPRFASDTGRRFREQFERVVGRTPSEDPWEELSAAAEAVFASWESDRAVQYRTHHGIPHEGGTAVTVQAMVFGNLDDASGSGVLFSRNPLTGSAEPYGEWIPRGQGEDVVSGRVDAHPLAELATSLPDVHAELLAAAALLERQTTEVQDIEFTVESGRLFLLQTRTAKRSPDAAARFSVSMCREGVISRDEALRRITDAEVATLLRPRIEPNARRAAVVLKRGEPASPGVGSGRVATSSEMVEALADEDVAAVLVRPTTDPEDTAGMLLATAVVTEVGGATSHAAVVSRELGTPCVVGVGTGTLAALCGRDVTVDGATGEVFDGVVPLAPSTEHDHPDLAVLADWARAVTGATGPARTVIAEARRLIQAGDSGAGEHSPSPSNQPNPATGGRS